MMRMSNVAAAAAARVLLPALLKVCVACVLEREKEKERERERERER